MPITYPILDNDLPFLDYIASCRALISARREDLQQAHANKERIITVNSPYELRPTSAQSKCGVLLIHGLFDCPFSLRDIANQLQAQQVLCKSILLPGHGTISADLLTVTYEEWIAAVAYGIENLKKEVEEIFLVGYSTGGALAIFHALHDDRIKGIVLIAPAIKIKAPVDTIFNWHTLIQWASKKRQWLFQNKEIDYAKYLSVAINPVTQVSKLTTLIEELHKQQTLQTKVMIITSREDETISSRAAMQFFSQLPNKENLLLLYVGSHQQEADSRILSRLARFPELQIRHFSHVSLPFSPDNFHYGQQGDYTFASHVNNKQHIYGAYNRFEESTYEFLSQCGLIAQQRRQLTYNPDFNFMAKKIIQFILRST